MLLRSIDEIHIVYRTCFVCPCSCSWERKTNFTLRIAIPIPKMPFINRAGQWARYNTESSRPKYFLIFSGPEAL